MLRLAKGFTCFKVLVSLDHLDKLILPIPYFTDGDTGPQRRLAHSDVANK